MPPKFLSPEEVEKMMKLAEGSYRPKVILDLIEEIEAEKRALSVNYASTGMLDQERANNIVQMMLKKDALYGAWTRGEIE